MSSTSLRSLSRGFKFVNPQVLTCSLIYSILNVIVNDLSINDVRLKKLISESRREVIQWLEKIVFFSSFRACIRWECENKTRAHNNILMCENPLKSNPRGRCKSIFAFNFLLHNFFLRPILPSSRGGKRRRNRH